MSRSLKSDEDKRRGLKKVRLLATGAGVMASIVYAVSVFLQPKYPVGWLKALAEAAMVGAFADWFAVTALFKHPFGIPSRHTAIIPKNKDRIADNLGVFVQEEFFSTDRILRVIEKFDPAWQAGNWLGHVSNAQRIAQALNKTALYGLRLLERPAVSEFLRKTLSENFAALDLSALAGRVLRGLTHKDRHQALFDQALLHIEEYLSEAEVQREIARRVNWSLDESGWFSRNVLNMRNALGDHIGEKIVAAVGGLLREISGDASHPLRIEFNVAVQKLIDRLEDDQDLRDQIRRYQSEFSKNQELMLYIDAVWRDVFSWLKNDLGSARSVIQENMKNLALKFGEELLANAALRADINTYIQENAPGLLSHHRPKLGKFIAEEVKKWRKDEIVDKIQLNIGSDLQYIRLNGTVIGGLAGLVIYFATEGMHAIFTRF